MENIINKFFFELRANQVNYAVLRPSEDMVNDNDIDILLTKNDLLKAHDILSQLGFITLKTPGHWPSTFYLIYDKDIDRWVKFDISTEVAFGHPHKTFSTNLITDFLTNTEVKNDYLVLNQTNEYINLIFNALIDKDDVTLKHQKRLNELIKSNLLNKDVVVNKLTEICGVFDLTEFEKAVELENKQMLKALRNKIINSFEKTLKCKKIRKQQRILKSFYTKFKGFLFPKPSVAILGTDGAGKSSISKALHDKLPFRVSSIYMGWGGGDDYFVLPTTKWLYAKFKKPPTSITTNKSAVVDKEQNVAKIKGTNNSSVDKKISLVLNVKKIMITLNEYFELFARYLISRLHKYQGKVVLFDRYVYDQEIYNRCVNEDKLTSHNKILAFLFQNLFPSAEITLLLDADPVEINRRKNELEVEDIAKRIEEYKKIGSGIRNFHIVDANQSIEHVVKDLQQIIWDYIKLSKS